MTVPVDITILLVASQPTLGARHRKAVFEAHSLDSVSVCPVLDDGVRELKIKPDPNNVKLADPLEAKLFHRDLQRIPCKYYDYT